MSCDIHLLSFMYLFISLFILSHHQPHMSNSFHLYLQNHNPFLFSSNKLRVNGSEWMDLMCHHNPGVCNLRFCAIMPWTREIRLELQEFTEKSIGLLFVAALLQRNYITISDSRDTKTKEMKDQIGNLDYKIANLAVVL